MRGSWPLGLLLATSALADLSIVQQRLPASPADAAAVSAPVATQKQVKRYAAARNICEATTGISGNNGLIEEVVQMGLGGQSPTIEQIRQFQEDAGDIGECNVDSIESALRNLPDGRLPLPSPGNILDQLPSVDIPALPYPGAIAGLAGAVVSEGGLPSTAPEQESLMLSRLVWAVTNQNYQPAYPIVVKINGEIACKPPKKQGVTKRRDCDKGGLYDYVVSRVDTINFVSCSAARLPRLPTPRPCLLLSLEPAGKSPEGTWDVVPSPAKIAADIERHCGRVKTGPGHYDNLCNSPTRVQAAARFRALIGSGPRSSVTLRVTATELPPQLATEILYSTAERDLAGTKFAKRPTRSEVLNEVLKARGIQKERASVALGPIYGRTTSDSETFVGVGAYFYPDNRGWVLGSLNAYQRFSWLVGYGAISDTTDLGKLTGNAFAVGVGFDMTPGLTLTFAGLFPDDNLEITNETGLVGTDDDKRFFIGLSINSNILAQLGLGG